MKKELPGKELFNDILQGHAVSQDALLSADSYWIHPVETLLDDGIFTQKIVDIEGEQIVLLELTDERQTIPDFS